MADKMSLKGRLEYAGPRDVECALSEVRDLLQEDERWVQEAFEPWDFIFRAKGKQLEVEFVIHAPSQLYFALEMIAEALTEDAVSGNVNLRNEGPGATRYLPGGETVGVEDGLNAYDA